jgi:hypothetical protein
MKLNIKAILIGWVVGFAGAMVISVLLGIIIAVSLISGGVTPEQIPDRMSHSPLMSIGLPAGLIVHAVSG